MRLALLLAALLLPASAVADEDECGGGRYACAEHPPAWYAEKVRTVDHPADGADAACLKRLADASIRYRLLADVEGVHTPIEVTDDSLGLVKYVPAAGEDARLILDCHTVEVLAHLGRAIRKAGVSTLHWSSSWRYSLRKDNGKLSQHALGKALDIVAIEGAFGYATVRGHYEKGLLGCGDEGATEKARVWRALLCAIRGEDGAFATVYTPDTDALHADHLHLEGADPAVEYAPTRAKKAATLGVKLRRMAPVLGGVLVGLMVVVGIAWQRRQKRRADSAA